MEYGRLVVLGYSSYRVATVRRDHPPLRAVETLAAPPPSSSFGLPDIEANGAMPHQQVTHASPIAMVGDPAVPRPSPGAAANSRNGVQHKKSHGQLWEPIGDQNAHYILQKRKRPNGVVLSHFHHFSPTQTQKLQQQQSASKHRPAGASMTSLSASSSSSSSSKELKALTKRMMQEIDAKRAEEARIASASASADGGSQPSKVSSDVQNGCSSSSSSRSPSSYLMCVPMNDHDAHASITEYHSDPTTDMFQIGRMPCRQNDFVIPGPRVGASGTISRFAARIICNREPPYECRLYAGGFDASKKMSTAGHALKYCAGCATWLKRVPMNHNCVTKQFVNDRNNNQETQFVKKVDITTMPPHLQHLECEMQDPSEVQMDGLTKNGVRVWLPEHKQWYEVSVNGNLYSIESRVASSPTQQSGASDGVPSTSGSNHGSMRNGAFNRPTLGAVQGIQPILTDGAVIDLGGVQLQFQTNHLPLGTENSAADALNTPVIYGRGNNTISIVSQLEKLNIQCPVQLHALRFTRPEPGEEVDPDQIPHVFPACGHVFGYEERIAESKTCPLCRTPGNLVQLLLKENSQLQSAAEQRVIPECVLNPCGHAINRKLASHYASLLMPNGRAICPFCAVHLDAMTPYSRLYLYSEDESV